jgi:hypothetical protein
MGTDGVKFTKVDTKNIAIEEEDGREGLVLRAGGDAMLDGEIGEKGFDMGSAKRVGMLESRWCPMEANVAFDPIGVAILGGASQVAKASDVADLIEKFHGKRLPVGNCRY